MKTILCYGDSNTWGADASTGGRFPREVRWTGVLQRELGAEYYVIEEGLGGRTTVWDDPIEGHKNGKTYLIPCLTSHRPLDLVVLMLGTNDLKHRFSLTAFDIAAGIGTLIDLILTSRSGPDNSAPHVLLLTPPRFGTLSGNMPEMFTGVSEKLPLLSRHYRRVAAQYGCAFLDTTEFLDPSPLDGVHLDAAGHHLLAERVAEQVKIVFA
jgi:lysophospholipase L1-like esterase